jgi:hypothetical protein
MNEITEVLEGEEGILIGDKVVVGYEEEIRVALRL